ncbi:hypothetical protein POSPLADRAFT_1043954 [Postia placenta MAD-698-R-SB12]|uniref:Zn(2)-C6 fungal-type domain-containing protein n=1 Tax=Postia placenta MAD-698-R-SB12 TaxID=670580 RepID=A0A1X6ND54_9APHY|nr:hypothetical protein POSPLADRAFT_1043954 [Postia placenta MAD-698-R-SB12]OSX66551.1 hypothetical protein POSPLADRAFT_1043954 [Postia placenta MAD-698-R-SB12]
MPAGEDRGRALRDHRARGKPSRPVPEKEGREIITNSDGKLPVDEGAVDLVNTVPLQIFVQCDIPTRLLPSHPLSMDDIQIVFEAPQAGQPKKKRARLVTSCDHCRLKKIKCVQSRNSSKCEACTTSRVPCRFRDREQYFAERGRLVSRNSPTSSDQDVSATEINAQIPLSVTNPQNTRLSHSPPLDTVDSSAALHRHSNTLAQSWSSTQQVYQQPSYVQAPIPPSPPQNSWHASYPVPQPSVSPASSLSDSFSYGATSERHTTTQSSILPLLDPQWPDRPNPTLMMHFIQTYFDRYGASFPCLAYDETIRQFLDQSLSPLIGASIAALAVWYSDLPEVLTRGAAEVSAVYCSLAERLVARGPQAYSVEAVHGLILLAWAEYKRAHMPDFCSHVKKAKYIAERVGLTNGSLIQSAVSEYERNILQSTWTILRQLISTVDGWAA